MREITIMPEKAASETVVRVKDNEKVRINMLCFEQARSKHRLKVIAEGDNTETVVACAFKANNNAENDLAIDMSFLGKNGKGIIMVSGVVDDAARVKVDGQITAGKKAAGTEAVLQEKVLLFGDRSVCDATPTLSIYTDNVSASHGASVSRVDDEDLFYLQSRGIKKKEAENLIANGLLQGLFEGLPASHPILKKLHG